MKVYDSYHTNDFFINYKFLILKLRGNNQDIV